MTASFHILRIEARRSPALWSLPLILGVAWLFEESYLTSYAPLWEDAGVVVQDLLFFVGPLMGGLAAWVGARDARRGMEDVLITTARPRIAQVLMAWGGMLVWGLAAYLLAIAAVLGITYLRGAPGAPLAWPVAIALLGLFAHAAVGLAAGYLVRSRFTGPLTAIGMIALMPAPGFLADMLAESGISMPLLKYLSPVGYGLRPEDLWIPQALLLAAIGGAALASLALRVSRSPASWATLLASIALMAAAIPSFL